MHIELKIKGADSRKGFETKTFESALALVEKIFRRHDIEGSYLLEPKNQVRMRNAAIRLNRHDSREIILSIRPGDSSTGWEYRLTSVGKDGFLLPAARYLGLWSGWNGDGTPASVLAHEEGTSTPDRTRREDELSISELLGAARRAKVRKERAAKIEKEKEDIEQYLAEIKKELGDLQKKVASFNEELASLAREEAEDVVGQKASELLLLLKEL